MNNKSVKVKVTGGLLEIILGLKGKGISIKYAQMNYDYLGRADLQLILEGEGLPEEFKVEDHELIKEGIINIKRNSYREIIETWITPV